MDIESNISPCHSVLGFFFFFPLCYFYQFIFSIFLLGWHSFMPPASISDVIGQQNKIDGITFRAAIVRSPLASSRLRQLYRNYHHIWTPFNLSLGGNIL